MRKDWYDDRLLVYIGMGEEYGRETAGCRAPLRALSVTGKLVGFQYAIYMIEQITDDPARVRLITKRLYPETAEQFGTTGSAVERAIRNLIYAVWDRTDHTLLEHIAGTPLKRPPVQQ